VIVVALVVVVVLGATLAWTRFGTSASVDPATAARTSLPGLAPATGEPTLPSLDDLHPAAGTVVQAPGPFDERFRLTGLRFDGTVVSGTATVTSDVSEILEFDAIAGFYDRGGRLVGTGHHVFHLDESAADPGDTGKPSEIQRLRITVPPELRGVAVAAAVGVPVLVNE